MKKRTKISLTAIIMTVAISVPAFAGSWEHDGDEWRYQNDDGHYTESRWQWIDGNKDGISECYYFDGNGHMLKEGAAPDGSTVNADGCWIVNGVVQTQENQASDTSVLSSAGYTDGLNNIVLDIMRNTRSTTRDQYQPEVMESGGGVTGGTYVYSDFPFSVQYFADVSNDDYSRDNDLSSYPYTITMTSDQGDMKVIFPDMPDPAVYDLDSAYTLLKDKGYNCSMSEIGISREGMCVVELPEVDIYISYRSSGQNELIVKTKKSSVYQNIGSLMSMKTSTAAN